MAGLARGIAQHTLDALSRSWNDLNKGAATYSPWLRSPGVVVNALHAERPEVRGAQTKTWGPVTKADRLETDMANAIQQFDGLFTHFAVPARNREVRTARRRKPRHATNHADPNTPM